MNHSKGTKKVSAIMMLVVPCGDVMEMLSTEHASNKKANKRIFFQKVQFLGRQGLALNCGHEDLESNFIQLYKLRSIESVQLRHFTSSPRSNCC